MTVLSERLHSRCSVFSGRFEERSMHHKLKPGLLAVLTLIAVIASATAVDQDAASAVDTAPSGTRLGEGAGHLKP